MTSFLSYENQGAGRRSSNSRLVPVDISSVDIRCLEEELFDELTMYNIGHHQGQKSQRVSQRGRTKCPPKQLWSSEFSKQLENFSCNNVLTNSTPINCGGVPTRTTPTLTPTTLRNIEQTFMELQSQVESHQNEAGFVPPLLEPSTISSSLVSSAASSDLSGLDDGVSNHSSGDSAIMSGEESGPLSIVRAPSGNGSNLFMSVVDTKSWQGGSATVIQPQNSSNSNSVATSSATRINSNQHLIPPHVVAAINGSSVGSSTSATTVTNGRRNTGGRRPNKENGLSAEEEERRKMRRERNKLAAARCRKRRLDHTNELIEETEDLEGKKQKLQDEIEQLQLQKEELEFLLEAHKPCCKILHPNSPEDVKPFLLTPSDEIVNSTLDLILKNDVKNSSLFSSSSLSSTFSSSLITCNGVPTSVESKPRAFTCNGVPTSVENKPKARPSTLPVTSTFLPISSTSNSGSNANELVSCTAGIPISTPSRGISLLTFDTLLEGGTGLTPLLSSASSFVPSCSSQQRNSNNVDLTSPESVPTKLVSL